jgi:hypothetical protein
MYHSELIKVSLRAALLLNWQMVQIRAGGLVGLAGAAHKARPLTFGVRYPSSPRANPRVARGASLPGAAWNLMSATPSPGLCRRAVIRPGQSYLSLRLPPGTSSRDGECDAEVAHTPGTPLHASGKEPRIQLRKHKARRAPRASSFGKLEISRCTQTKPWTSYCPKCKLPL